MLLRPYFLRAAGLLTLRQSPWCGLQCWIMPTSVITAADLVKKYKDFPAVDGISFLD
ncbi:hypothetical protein ACFQ9V_00665 [Leifsonia sp. NPDC056665]|uniref:hypothetical protein n=1 Tax=Leifsonia sp. NPDC056665 TaxID=3345901 RepID=UPI0036936AFE